MSAYSAPGAENLSRLKEELGFTDKEMADLARVASDVQ